MVAGKRFDLESAKAEAAAKKAAEQQKKLISTIVLVVVVIALIVGAVVGWNVWQEKREAAAEEARMAQAAEEARAAKAKAKAEQERREFEEKRKAEQAAKEAERKREREEREAERKRQQEEREKLRLEKEEARKREREERVEQTERRRYAEQIVGSLKFDVADRVVPQKGLKGSYDLSVQDVRWASLAASAKSGRDAIAFAELLRDENDTNEVDRTKYPSAQVMDGCVARLKEERFTMMIRLRPNSNKDHALALVDGAPEAMLEAPAESQALTDEKGVIGWTVPFTYGKPSKLLLMNASSAERLRREWAEIARKVRRDWSKGGSELVVVKMKEASANFAQRIDQEMERPTVEEPADAAAVKSAVSAKSKEETKKRVSLKGPDNDRRSNNNSRNSNRPKSDIRTMGGPSDRR